MVAKSGPHHVVLTYITLLRTTYGRWILILSIFNISRTRASLLTCDTTLSQYGTDIDLLGVVHLRLQ
jgi:hypothetical protein